MPPQATWGQMWLTDTFYVLYSRSDICIHIKKYWVLYKGIPSNLCTLKRYAEVLAVLPQTVTLLSESNKKQ